MTSSSVAYSQFAPQFRYSFPWKRPRWTGNGKKLLTPLPAGGLRGLHQRWPLPLKLHFLCGRSGILLAPVCFTSFACFCSSWPTAGSSKHNSSRGLPTCSPAFFLPGFSFCFCCIYILLKTPNKRILINKIPVKFSVVVMFHNRNTKTSTCISNETLNPFYACHGPVTVISWSAGAEMLQNNTAVPRSARMRQDNDFPLGTSKNLLCRTDPEKGPLMFMLTTADPNWGGPSMKELHSGSASNKNVIYFNIVLCIIVYFDITLRFKYITFYCLMTRLQLLII